LTLFALSEPESKSFDSYVDFVVEIPTLLCSQSVGLAANWYGFKALRPPSYCLDLVDEN
jgi:hypothetical protein